MPDLAFVRSCVLPLNLYYKIEEHLWLRPGPEGDVTLGFTDVAQTTAGKMLIVSFRPLGPYRRGKALAVVESAKWLGPLRAPAEGTLLDTNAALLTDANLINRNPYGAGWIVRFRPTDPAAILEGFVTGAAAMQAYETFMDRQNLDDCIHCEGYELPEE